ncbi:MAG: hypothetical protein RRC07_07880 [Anaerolineae bacterium]|nr:hypothetical protein [Anaerolineae bacterium]
MKSNQKLLAFLLGGLLAFVFVLAVLYFRQRLFTRTDPIVLAP